MARPHNGAYLKVSFYSVPSTTCYLNKLTTYHEKFSERNVETSEIYVVSILRMFIHPPFRVKHTHFLVDRGACQRMLR